MKRLRSPSPENNRSYDVKSSLSYLSKGPAEKKKIIGENSSSSFVKRRTSISYQDHQEDFNRKVSPDSTDNEAMQTSRKYSLSDESSHSNYLVSSSGIPYYESSEEDLLKEVGKLKRKVNREIKRQSKEARKVTLRRTINRLLNTGVMLDKSDEEMISRCRRIMISEFAGLNIVTTKNHSAEQNVEVNSNNNIDTNVPLPPLGSPPKHLQQPQIKLLRPRISIDTKGYKIF